jgi:PAS domain S-box-containing protein
MTQLSDQALENFVQAALSCSAKRDDAAVSEEMRRQTALVAMGHRVTAPVESAALLRDAAALLGEMLDVELCGTAQREGEALVLWLAGATNSDEERDPVERIEDNAAGSMIAYAMQVGRPVVSSSLIQEDRFVDSLLELRGVCSAVVAPIRVEDRSVAAIGVFSRGRRTFRAEDVLFIESVVQLLSATIAREQALIAVEAQNRLQSAILDTVDAMVLDLTPDGKINASNRACRNLTGFGQDELRERAIWNALLIPEEVDLVKTEFQSVLEGKSSTEFSGQILNKQGERRRVDWRISAMRDLTGETRSLIATGVDVTDREHALESASHSRAVAARAKQTIEALQEQIRQASNTQSPFEKLRGVEGGDRRDRARRAYPYLQMVAPVRGGRLPMKDEFREVRCRDIAAGGFSFVVSEPAQHTSYVVAFGASPSLTYIKAKVVHRTAMEIDGHLVYVVGCEYSDRVEY